MGEPRLRFKADDGSDFPDWEEMTLGDIGSVAMCKRVFKEQTCEVGDVPFFKIGTFGGAPDAYISQSLFDELKSKYAYPKVGTILLSASGTIGRQVEYKGEDAYYQDSNIVWLEHDDTVLDSYLKQFYSVVKWQGLEGSTIKRLYNKTILDTPFYRPSLPEQRKIADFLSAVDAVIAAQQAEVDAWEQRKKGVIQKLFSQEVRFKADDGSEFPAWEEKTLGEIIQEYREYCEKDGTYEHVSLTKDGVIPKTERYDRDYLVKRADKKYRVTHMNDICYNPANLKFGVICRNTYGDGIFSPIYITYRVNESYDPAFIEALVVRDSFIQQALRFQEGTVYERMSVSPSDFESMLVSVPSLSEQHKIADCLASMDEVIQKSKDELAKWQELKKGLLQQMFV